MNGNESRHNLLSFDFEHIDRLVVAYGNYFPWADIALWTDGANRGKNGTIDSRGMLEGCLAGVSISQMHKDFIFTNQQVVRPRVCTFRLQPFHSLGRSSQSSGEGTSPF